MMRLLILLLLGWVVAGCQKSSQPKLPFEPGPGSVVISGTLTDEGVECQALRDESGRLYTLIGPTSPFHNGARVCVRGRALDVEYCMQGIAIQIEAIRPASECR